MVFVPPPFPLNPVKKCYISTPVRERKIILPGLKSPNAFSGCNFPSEQFLAEWADKITLQTIRLKDRIFIIIRHHSCNRFISGIPCIFIPLKGKGTEVSEWMLHSGIPPPFYCSRSSGCIYCCSTRVSQGSPVLPEYSSCTLHQPWIPYQDCGIIKYQSGTELKYVLVTLSSYRFTIM